MGKHKRSYLRKAFGNEKLQKFLILVATTGVLFATVLFELSQHGTGVTDVGLSMIAGAGMLVLVVGFVSLLSIQSHNARILTSTSDLALISMVLIFGTIISASTEIISVYLIPTGFISMLISVIYGPLAALSVSIPFAAVMLCITNFNVGFVVVFVIGCITGILFTQRTSIRNSIVLGGIVIGMINGLAVLSMELITDQNRLNVLVNSLLAVLGGLFSAVFTIGFLPVFEQLFDINTPVRLLELSNPNQPLMKKLLFEAPGTYHHSILVGNLSEAAAETIGANSLLARVGAYYHDIGKIKRPYFFKENQISNDNPHDKITPKLSSIIITSHVKDGLELAEKYKLPKAIVRIIEEHHGDTLVKYFYTIAASACVEAAASADGEGTEVDESHFRYSGPRPTSRESGIVMLADSVEAAVRSLQAPTTVDIERMVEKIIKDKIDDNQLNDCDLTMRELEKIRKSFIKVLGGMFHSRIEYPELSEETSVEEIINDRI